MLGTFADFAPEPRSRASYAEVLGRLERSASGAAGLRAVANSTIVILRSACERTLSRFFSSSSAGPPCNCLRCSMMANISPPDEQVNAGLGFWPCARSAAAVARG